jgi:8-oxo-dGTP diphosphatase
MEKNNIEEKLIKEALKDNIQRFVVGAVIKNNQKTLILRRKPDDFFGGIDELPSGKVEAGESLFAALSREVVEETGLVIDEVVDYLGHFDYRSKSGNNTRQFNFLVKVKSCEVHINPDEHIGYDWIDINDLQQTKLTDSVITIISRGVSE